MFPVCPLVNIPHGHAVYADGQPDSKFDLGRVADHRGSKVSARRHVVSH